MVEAVEVLRVLMDLEYSLRSKSNPQEKITSEEESFFRNLKGELGGSFVTGALVSWVVCWTGTRRFGFTRRFGYGPSLIYSAGAGFLGGREVCRWSVHSCLDPIISADGTRMQRELAEIMISKQQAGQLRPSFISKHLYRLFYPERVFMDSQPDKLYTRWRMRKTYEDIIDVGNSQKLAPESSKPTTRVTTSGLSTELLKPTTRATRQRSQKQEVKSQRNNMVHENPLDCILGIPGSDQETEPNNSIARPRKTSHAHKRAHRRHRVRDHKARDRSQSVGLSVVLDAD